MNVVAFFDDASRKQGTQIHGNQRLRCTGAAPSLKEGLGLPKGNHRQPSASSKRLREVFCILNQQGWR